MGAGWSLRHEATVQTARPKPTRVHENLQSKPFFHVPLGQGALRLYTILAKWILLYSIVSVSAAVDCTYAHRRHRRNVRTLHRRSVIPIEFATVNGEERLTARAPADACAAPVRGTRNFGLSGSVPTNMNVAPRCPWFVKMSISCGFVVAGTARSLQFDSIPCGPHIAAIVCDEPFCRIASASGCLKNRFRRNFRSADSGGSTAGTSVNTIPSFKR